MMDTCSKVVFDVANVVFVSPQPNPMQMEKNENVGLVEEVDLK